MNLGLDGKVVIISGSSRGIGLGIAGVLLAEGARVVLTGRDETSLEAAFGQCDSRYPGQVTRCAGDLNDPSALRAVEAEALRNWPGIDGIVANAGAVKPIAEWDITEADWDWYRQANFEVARRFIQHFTPRLKTSRGCVVVINSIAGIADVGAPLPYSSAKSALKMYAASLARRLARDGVRVNTIAPGNIRFPGGNWAEREATGPESVRRMLEERVPLRRFGTPEEIGQMTAFLLSDKAAFMTGSCVVVDGGQTAGL